MAFASSYVPVGVGYLNQYWVLDAVRKSSIIVSSVVPSGVPSVVPSEVPSVVPSVLDLIRQVPMVP